MKRVLPVLTVLAAAAALFFGGCTPAAGTNQKAAAPGDAADAVDPRERYAGGGGRTFLDTLNQGKEIALSAEDIPALELSGESAPAPAGETRFRVQIMASSQIDMVRKEKISAEAAINQPVFMASEQSLYKLYVGDFKTKAEAEAILPEVKSKGYRDAWVVNTK
jgi:hypothetical protein